MDYPSICCLCPTYGRPKLLDNAVECFLRQDYPHQRCTLLIVDDLGTIARSDNPRIEVHSQNWRFLSLPEKYNWSWRWLAADLYVVMEDDDVFLPWHLMSHARACEYRGWSYPSEVWSDYGGIVHTEESGGRFHGSLAIRRETLEQLGGWPDTKRADFDQKFISNLKEIGKPGDPLDFSPERSPSYVFRYSTTGQPHGQNTMNGPDDTSWYDRYVPPDPSGPHTIRPELDESAKWIFRQLVPGYEQPLLSRRTS
jgi:hypothetical protein